MIQIYTDGGFQSGRAGWAYLVLSPEGSILSSRAGELFAPPLTSQRAELFAAINALKRESYPKVEIISDSQYLVKGMTEWILTWQRNGWRTSQRRVVVNQDLWVLLLDQVKNRVVKWRWIGRDSVIWNTRVDALVVEVLCTPQKQQPTR